MDNTYKKSKSKIKSKKPNTNPPKTLEEEEDKENRISSDTFIVKIENTPCRLMAKKIVSKQSKPLNPSTTKLKENQNKGGDNYSDETLEILATRKLIFENSIQHVQDDIQLYKITKNSSQEEEDISRKCSDEQSNESNATTLPTCEDKLNPSGNRERRIQFIAVLQDLLRDKDFLKITNKNTVDLMAKAIQIKKSSESYRKAQEHMRYSDQVKKNSKSKKPNISTLEGNENQEDYINNHGSNDDPTKTVKTPSSDVPQELTINADNSNISNNETFIRIDIDLAGSLGTCREEEQNTCSYYNDQSKSEKLNTTTITQNTAFVKVSITLNNNGEVHNYTQQKKITRDKHCNFKAISSILEEEQIKENIINNHGSDDCKLTIYIGNNCSNEAANVQSLDVQQELISNEEKLPLLNKKIFIRAGLDLTNNRGIEICSEDDKNNCSHDQYKSKQQNVTISTLENYENHEDSIKSYGNDIERKVKIRKNESVINQSLDASEKYAVIDNIRNVPNKEVFNKINIGLTNNNSLETYKEKEIYTPSFCKKQTRMATLEEDENKDIIDNHSSDDFKFKPKVEINEITKITSISLTEKLEADTDDQKSLNKITSNEITNDRYHEACPDKEEINGKCSEDESGSIKPKSIAPRLVDTNNDKSGDSSNDFERISFSDLIQQLSVRKNSTVLPDKPIRNKIRNDGYPKNYPDKEEVGRKCSNYQFKSTKLETIILNLHEKNKGNYLSNSSNKIAKLLSSDIPQEQAVIEHSRKGSEISTLIKSTDDYLLETCPDEKEMLEVSNDFKSLDVPQELLANEDSQELPDEITLNKSTNTRKCSDDQSKKPNIIISTLKHQSNKASKNYESDDHSTFITKLERKPSTCGNKIKTSISDVTKESQNGNNGELSTIDNGSVEPCTEMENNSNDNEKISFSYVYKELNRKEDVVVNKNNRYLSDKEILDGIDIRVTNIKHTDEENNAGYYCNDQSENNSKKTKISTSTIEEDETSFKFITDVEHKFDPSSNETAKLLSSVTHELTVKEDCLNGLDKKELDKMTNDFFLGKYPDEKEITRQRSDSQAEQEKPKMPSSKPEEEDKNENRIEFNLIDNQHSVGKNSTYNHNNVKLMNKSKSIKSKITLSTIEEEENEENLGQCEVKIFKITSSRLEDEKKNKNQFDISLIDNTGKKENNNTGKYNNVNFTNKSKSVEAKSTASTTEEEESEETYTSNRDRDDSKLVTTVERKFRACSNDTSKIQSSNVSQKLIITEDSLDCPDKRADEIETTCQRHKNFKITSLTLEDKEKNKNRLDIGLIDNKHTVGKININFTSKSMKSKITASTTEEGKNKENRTNNRGQDDSAFVTKIESKFRPCNNDTQELPINGTHPNKKDTTCQPCDKQSNCKTAEDTPVAEQNKEDNTNNCGGNNRKFYMTINGKNFPCALELVKMISLFGPKDMAEKVNNPNLAYDSINGVCLGIFKTHPENTEISETIFVDGSNSNSQFKLNDLETTKSTLEVDQNKETRINKAAGMKNSVPVSDKGPFKTRISLTKDGCIVAPPKEQETIYKCWDDHLTEDCCGANKDSTDVIGGTYYPLKQRCGCELDPTIVIEETHSNEKLSKKQERRQKKILASFEELTEKIKILKKERLQIEHILLCERKKQNGKNTACCQIMNKNQEKNDHIDICGYMDVDRLLNIDQKKYDIKVTKALMPILRESINQMKKDNHKEADEYKDAIKNRDEHNDKKTNQSNKKTDDDEQVSIDKENDDNNATNDSKCETCGCEITSERSGLVCTARHLTEEIISLQERLPGYDTYIILQEDFHYHSKRLRQASWFLYTAKDDIQLYDDIIICERIFLESSERLKMINYFMHHLKLLTPTESDFTGKRIVLTGIKISYSEYFFPDHTVEECFFIVIASCGTELEASEYMLARGRTGTFSKTWVYDNLPSDFEIKLGIYCLCLSSIEEYIWDKMAHCRYCEKKIFHRAACSKIKVFDPALHFYSEAILTKESFKKNIVELKGDELLSDKLKYELRLDDIIPIPVSGMKKALTAETTKRV